jgi:hypothetical protein
MRGVPPNLFAQPWLSQRMKTNEAGIDRVLRVVIGLVLLSFVFIGPQTAWGWIGLVPLLTGVVGFCPLYRLLGVDTCRLGGCSRPAEPRSMT